MGERKKYIPDSSIPPLELNSGISYFSYSRDGVRALIDLSVRGSEALELIRSQETGDAPDICPSRLRDILDGAIKL